jgi:hypothetical protein
MGFLVPHAGQCCGNSKISLAAARPDEIGCHMMRAKP